MEELNPGDDAWDESCADDEYEQRMRDRDWAILRETHQAVRVTLLLCESLLCSFYRRSWL